MVTEKAEAMPTKGFFIKMLTKDIEILPAIADLVDNSIDGARRLRPDGHWRGLWVRVECRPDKFVIQDNCGGISIDTAVNYAFRFGRPGEAESGADKPGDSRPVAGGIGLFGVGMKRALFKLGNNFRVRSTTFDSRFEVEVDVEAWRKLKEWAFPLEVSREISVPGSKTGTKIEAWNLADGVESEFARENFPGDLSVELSRRESAAMIKGIGISVNGTAVGVDLARLRQSALLKPVYIPRELTDVGEVPVSVKIYVGVSDSSKEEAGWYVYCNGRLVLGPDRSLETGWGFNRDTEEEPEVGEEPEEPRKIPKFHGQFDRFRGYAFFDSEDGSLLPWNTTKTSIDPTSRSWKEVRVDMRVAMRRVIDFLNGIDEEMGLSARYTPLTTALSDTRRVSLDVIKPSAEFVSPEAQLPPWEDRMGRITYKRKNGLIQSAREQLKVRTKAEVGERTFDYYIEAEVE